MGKLLESSVTLKEGWRKILLPGLDLRKSTKQQQEAPFGGRSLADSVVSLSVQASKLDSKERINKANYEKGYLKSLVKETNVNGRSSVRNMLDMFGSGGGGDQRRSLNEHSSALPSIR